MILIADSGSTKADWKIIYDDGQIDSHSSRGFNPFYNTSDEIYQALKASFGSEFPTERVNRIYYYGAGCSQPERNQIVENGLQKLFTNADIEVDHDLLAAARATCGRSAGFACIIGTGSNSCAYDGDSVIDNVTNLGFMLGDEGSGSYLGKALVRAFYYRELPEDLHQKFVTKYNLTDYKSILNEVYDTDEPNRYLASFSPFLSENKDHIFIQKIVGEAFSEFIKRHIRKYKNHNELPIHFIGSVAYYFQDILQMVLKEGNMKMGMVIKKPIDNLVKFHQEYKAVGR